MINNDIMKKIKKIRGETMEQILKVEIMKKSFEEMMKIMKRLEKPKKDKKKEAETLKILMEFKNNSAYFTRKSIYNTLKITWKANAVITEGEEVVGNIIADLEKLEEKYKKESAKEKGEFITICFVRKGQNIYLVFPQTKENFLVETDDKSNAYQKEKLDWTSFQDQDKWMDVLKHANLVLKKETGITPLLVNGMRILLKTRKTINYYFINERFPVDIFMMDNETVNILNTSVDKALAISKKGKRLLFLEEKTHGKDKELLGEVLYQILIRDKGDKGELEEIDFHAGNQSFFEIDATHVNNYLSYISSDTKQLRITPTNDGKELYFEPIPSAKELKLKESEEELLNAMPEEIKKQFATFYEEVKSLLGNHFEKNEVEKETKNKIKQYEKENWNFILECYGLTKNEEKTFKKTWDNSVKIIQNVLFHLDKNVTRKIPIDLKSEQLKPSLFDVEHFANLFIDKYGVIEVERRDFKNDKRRTGYLWTHKEPLNKIQYIAGYGEPPYEKIQELKNNGTLYQYIDEKTGELIL